MNRDAEQQIWAIRYRAYSRYDRRRTRGKSICDDSVTALSVSPRPLLPTFVLMSASAPGGESRREYYRLRYPSRERPTFDYEDRTFDLIELSEKGFRIRGPVASTLRHGQRIAGTLNLLTATLPIRGTVARLDANLAVVVAVSGVSFGCILDEQRKISRRFLSE